jgi:hypothetical protein
MFYDSDTQSVVLCDEYVHSSGMVYYCFFWIPKDGAQYYVSYSRYSSIYANNPQARGSCYIEPSGFDPDSPLPFTSYEGSERLSDGEVAAVSVALMLEVMDFILDTKFNASFSSADLGFNL